MSASYFSLHFRTAKAQTGPCFFVQTPFDAAKQLVMGPALLKFAGAV